MKHLTCLIAAAAVAAGAGAAENSKVLLLGEAPEGFQVKGPAAVKTVAGQACLAVPKGARQEVVFAKLWPADEFPADAYALRATYLDDFKGTQRLLSFINREGSYGWNELLAVDGTGDGKWKTLMTVADGGLLDHDTADTITLGLAAEAADWSVAKIELAPATAAEIAEARTRLFERVNRIVTADLARLKQVPSRAKPDPGSVKYELSAADRARGFVPFARDYMKIVHMSDTPGLADLKVVAARGEARPFTLGLRTLKSVSVLVRVGDLKSAEGKTLPAGAFEVGYLQYAPVIAYRSKTDYSIQPMHIWPVDRQPAVQYGQYSVTPKGGGALELSGDCAHRFWITLRVPAGQPAGTYTGKVYLAPGDRDAQPASLPLTVQVLPFELPATGARWTGCYSPTRLHADALRDQISHGCTMQSIWHNGADMPVRMVDGKPRCDTRAMDAYMKRMQRLGMTGPVVYFAGNDRAWMFDEDLIKAIKGPGYKMPDSQDQKNKAYLDQFKDPAYSAAYTDCLAALYAHAKQAGWNELIWCPFDEPAKGGVKATQWEIDAAAAKKAGKDIRVFCVVMNRGLKGRQAGAERFNPLSDIFSVNGAIPEVVKFAHPQHKQVWAYSAPNRFTSGFMMLRTGADTAFCWAYNWLTQGPTNFTWADSEPLDRQWNTAQTRTAWYVSYPDVDGRFIPTPNWELWRAGCDDNRYIALLRRLLEDGKGTPEGKRLAADFARLTAAIQANEASKDDEGIDEFVLSTKDASDMDIWRVRIAGWIVQLMKK